MTTGPDARRPKDSERSDSDVLFEQRRALFAAWWLSSLKTKKDSDKREFQIAHEWLADDPNQQYYLTHSHTYLNYLKGVRDEVLGPIREADRGGSERKAFQKAVERCKKELRDLDSADLFEPQRSHYKMVIRSWQDQLRRHAEDAVEVLEAMSSFNRHVYRPSADSLMADIDELALQVAPLSFTRTEKVLLTTRIKEALEAHPLVGNLFDHGSRLVNHTLLADTLLAVARQTVGWLEGTDTATHFTRDVTLLDIWEEIQDAARQHRFAIQRTGDRFDSRYTSLGNRAIWQTIIEQWIDNVYFHGRDPNAESPSAVLYVRFDDGPKQVLRISGEDAFLDCIKEEHQVEIDENESDHERARALERLAAETMEPRKQLGVNSSGGMGMFLIKLICDYVRLDAVLRLARADERSDRGGEVEPEVTLSSPLCLELSWDREIRA